MPQENNAQEILTSLSRLESSLKQIESARQQVEEVVKSAMAINSSIGDYTQSLNSLTDAVKAFIATAQEYRRSDAEAISVQISELCNRVDGMINELSRHDAPQPAQPTPRETGMAETAALAEMLEPVKARLDEINSKLEMANTAKANSPINENTAPLLSGINAKIESIDSKLKEIAIAHQHHIRHDDNAAPATCDNAATISTALKEFEERLNLISKDVMVMRNSTHSILKNMETQLIDRSSKEGRMSLIIAIGALVVAVTILLKLYGAI